VNRPPPLHEQIRARLEQEIVSGQRPPGSRLPFETELAAEWSCARMTAGRALQALAEAGMIERRRRAGSFVTRRSVQETVLDIHAVADEVRSLGRAYGYRRLTRSQSLSGQKAVELLGLTAPTEVLALTVLHLADGEGHALEERLINLAAAPQAADESFETQPPGDWLLAHIPWTEAEHEISALAADRTIARHLGIPVASPCLCLERRTWKSGLGVTYARLIYPADRQRFTARLRQPGGRREL
jgi:GntR family transcriptional regulator, histidine utilization repressor